MKNIIVTVAEILLGVVIFGLIFGDGSEGTIRHEVNSIFTDVLNQLGDVHN